VNSRIARLGLGIGLVIVLAAAISTRAAAAEPEAVLARQALRVLEQSLGGDAEVAAAKALADLGDPAAIERLERAVDENPRDAFAYAALVWIGRDPYVQRAIETVKSRETAVSAVTVYGAAFARHPNDVVAARLRGVFDDASQDPLERLWAASSLVEMGDEAPRKFLEEVLGGKDPYAAAIAAGALFGGGHPLARERLVKILEDRASEQWDQAAVSLGEHPDRDLLPLLRRSLRRAREPHDRVWLAWAVLRTIGYKHE